MSARIRGNGIYAESGRYAAEVTIDELYAAAIRAVEVLPPEELTARAKLGTARESGTLGTPQYVRPERLGHAGWGIIWPPQQGWTDAEERHRKALQELIQHRAAQVAAGKKLPWMPTAVRQFHYRPGARFDEFLWDPAGVQTGQMRTADIPYYLLIVGSPERIPWEFQFGLDGEYAVGRLWFDDPADCVRYVERLLAAERQGPKHLPSEPLFVAPENANDPATASSAVSLVQPLYEDVRQTFDFGQGDAGAEPRFLLRGAGATKAALLDRLRGQGNGKTPPPPVPALLLTGSHGMEYEQPGAYQFASQGALIMQDWPGPGTPVQAAHYLGAADVDASLDLTGTLSFCFACFSAGTPHLRDWDDGAAVPIAPAPFVARLPQKLLAVGQLAVVGHVSRAWDYSYLGVAGTNEQIVAFRSAVWSLLTGARVGHAMEMLNQSWVRLDSLLRQRKQDSKHDQAAVAELWMTMTDHRGYVVLGDPAVQLPAPVPELAGD